MEIKTTLKENIDNSYKIVVERGLISKIPKILKKEKYGERYAIITDNTVKKLFGSALQKQLKKAGIESEIFSFPKGESSKSLKTIEKLSEQMAEKNFSRRDSIIALGGGVVGDTGGFLASIYMRGIPYIHVPTTLLAMVDSAIGGKTGVDLEAGKNLIGTITQPKIVLIDPDYLNNFPEKQLINGMAEVIKYGVIRSTSLFKFIEQSIEKIKSKDKKTIEKLITESAKIKAKVVEEDEKEAGLRMILNYGHTYGHALEKLSNYTLLHGHAISIGMVIANKIAVEQKLLENEEAERIKKLLKNMGLPVITNKKVRAKDLLSDKKRVGNYINMILPKKIGQVIIQKVKCL